MRYRMWGRGWLRGGDWHRTALVTASALLLAAQVAARAPSGDGGSRTEARAATIIGERIFREGQLSSGAPLQAEREPGMHIEGATAACINCHRRSALGMT